MNSCCLGRLLLYSLPVGISFCILLVMRLTQKIKDILLIQFQSKPESWNCLAKDSQCWTWGRCRATSSAVVKWKIWKVRRFFKTCTNLRTESYPRVVLLPFEKKKIFVLALFVNLIIHAYSFTPFSSKWIAHFCFRLCVCWDIAFIFHKILNTSFISICGKNVEEHPFWWISECSKWTRKILRNEKISWRWSLHAVKTDHSRPHVQNTKNATDGGGYARFCFLCRDRAVQELRRNGIAPPLTLSEYSGEHLPRSLSRERTLPRSRSRSRSLSPPPR